MQRDREHSAVARAELGNLRHDAGGRDRDAALRQGQAVAIRENVDRIADIVEVIERLPHAHEDDVGDGSDAFSRRDEAIGRRGHAGKITDAVTRDDELLHDFLRRQVAHQLLRARVAERASQRAADLTRHAERAAVAFGNVDALDLGALVLVIDRGEADQPFARAVGRDLFSDDLRTFEREALRQLLAQRLADVEHAVEVADAVEIDPVPELPGPHADLAVGRVDLAQDLAETGARQAHEAARPDGGLRLGGGGGSVCLGHGWGSGSRA